MEGYTLSLHPSNLHNRLYATRKDHHLDNVPPDRYHIVAQQNLKTGGRMDEKSLCTTLAIFVFSSFVAVTGQDRIEPKMSSCRWHNFNRCEIPITNYGEFGYMYGYWPTGSGEHHIFGAGIWVGAIKHDDLLVSCGYSTIGAGSDWMPGPPHHNHDHSIDLRSHPEDRVYLSTSAVDRKEWPLRDSLGFPINLSGQDGWCEYNDLWEPQHSGEP